jgi:hypothetical protein
VIPGIRVSRVARLVVAIYPKAIRDRYGDEITDLLTQSSRPLRDLVDIGWCAILERGSFVSVPHLRSRVPQVVGVLAVPPVLGVALLTVASLGVLVVATVDAAASQSTIEIVMALAVAPVTAAAAWLGWRSSRQPQRAAWLFIVPALLTLSIVALSSVPIMGEALGEARVAVAVAAAVWCSLLTGLVVAVRRLAARFPWPAVVSALIVAGFVMLDLTFMAYGETANFSRPAALHLCYPSVLTMRDLGSPDAATDLAENLKGLPALLTACTAFTLAFANTAGRRTRRPAGPPIAVE